MKKVRGTKKAKVGAASGKKVSLIIFIVHLSSGKDWIQKYDKIVKASEKYFISSIKNVYLMNFTGKEVEIKKYWWDLYGMQWD